MKNNHLPYRICPESKPCIEGGFVLHKTANGSRYAEVLRSDIVMFFAGREASGKVDVFSELLCELM